MSGILDRVALLAKNENITIGALERTIGASKGVLSRAIQGNTDIQSKWLVKIVENYPHYSGTWLLTGTGEMRSSQSGPVAHQAQGSNRTAIPLIPYDAIAGYGSFDFQELPIEDFYTVEELRGADFLIRVKGDSMSPKYNGGDIVACKRIDAITFWQWHKVYAICTRNQGILIKRVEEYQNNPAFITCRSENPQYRPFELHEDEIVSVALVLGAIVLE